MDAAGSRYASPPSYILFRLRIFLNASTEVRLRPSRRLGGGRRGGGGGGGIWGPLQGRRGRVEPSSGAPKAEGKRCYGQPGRGYLERPERAAARPNAAAAGLRGGGGARGGGGGGPALSPAAPSGVGLRARGNRGAGGTEDSGWRRASGGWGRRRRGGDTRPAPPNGTQCPRWLRPRPPPRRSPAPRA